MEHFLTPASKPVDLNQVRYDLALIYAREKFATALRYETIPIANPKRSRPEPADETKYLMDQFNIAMHHYTNADEKSQLENLDPTYL